MTIYGSNAITIYLLISTDKKLLICKIDLLVERYTVGVIYELSRKPESHYTYINAYPNRTEQAKPTYRTVDIF